MLSLQIVFRSLWVAATLFVATVANAAVSVSPTTLTLAPGQQGIITLSYTTSSVTISNSDASVISISPSGISTSKSVTVTGIKAGTARVYVKSGTTTVSTSVTVKSGLTLSNSSITIATGQTGTVTISGATSVPTATSSNTSVVTASATLTTLTLTGKAAGVATVTVTGTNGTAKLAVTVTSTVTGSVRGNTVGRLLASNCFQCHGTYGSGGTLDKLTGMTSDELYKKLKEFPLDAEHSNSIMSAHLAGFTDAQLQAIAVYFTNP